MAANLDPLGDWRRTHYSTQILPGLDGIEVTVFGWVEEKRDLGNLSFFILRDREGSVQVTVSRGRAPPPLWKKAQEVGLQFTVGVRGVVKAMKEAPRGVEIVPTGLKILGAAAPPLPLDPTGRTPADIDVRLNARVLDLRRREAQAVFKVRHSLTNYIREYLVKEGFIEVHTPRLISAAAEGGASLFPVDYFGQRAFLAQSPELYKEMLTASFEKVFEIGPFFRAEESHTRRHLNEFVSVDIEQAFVSADDVMRVQEDLICAVLSRLGEERGEEATILGVEFKPPQKPLKRYRYSEILDELKGSGVEIESGEDIPTPAYRTLATLHKGEYYFITDWPTKTRPFYIKPRDEDPSLCQAFDFMYEWIEVTSGGTRIDSKEALTGRLKEHGLDPSSFNFFLKTFDYGMPPHAGWGMGLDRLMMALAGESNIREVVLFPRDRFRLTP
ncbi:MAG: aspartate--tRNA(Asn) ligase [Candidatus Bathyarchaeia archaeon]